MLQVRNTATIGGNIVNASPISDINAILMAAEARYEIVRAGGESVQLAPEDFIIGYRCSHRHTGPSQGLLVPTMSQYIQALL